MALSQVRGAARRLFALSVLLSRRAAGMNTLRLAGLAALAAPLLAGTPLAAQTAHFSGAITTLGSGFNTPSAVAVDSSGNVFVADSGNNAVKEMPAGCATSNCVTVLGGGFNDPAGVALDSSGNVYVADYGNNAMKEMPSGCTAAAYNGGTCTITTLGGGFDGPDSVTVDSSGNVYLGDDSHNAVKEMPPGCTAAAYSGGACTIKTLGGGFFFPHGVEVDSSGNVYVADTDHSAVKEMPPGCASSSCVTTLGGGFAYPSDVALDSSGNVYVADTGHGAVKEMPPGCASTSCVTTLRGGYYFPGGVALDGSGSVYVADYGSNSVTEIMRGSVNFFSVPIGSSSAAMSLTFTFDSAGTIGAPSVLTQGAAGLDFRDAGTGTCTTNGVSHSYAIGDTCTVNVTFNPIAPGLRMGAVELLAGSGNLIATGLVKGIGIGPEVVFSPSTISSLGSGFNRLHGVAVDGSGNLFVADTNNNAVKEMPPGCASPACITTLGGGFFGPYGVAVDGSGNVYVADSYNNAVKEMPPGCASSACVTTLGGGFSYPSGVAVDGGGNVYVADVGSNAVKEMPPGCASSACVTRLGGGFSAPYGVAVDGSGNVYVAGIGNNLVKEMPPGCTAAEYTAGHCTITTLGGGFDGPYGVAVDAGGSVYVTDGYHNAMKEMPSGCASSACVTTLGGGFNLPTGVTLDGSGNVFVADSINNSVKEVNRAASPSLTFASTPFGVQSSDSPQSVTVSNAGNASLTFPIPGTGDNPSIASGFTLDSATTCPQLSASSSAAGTLAMDASCVYAVDFIPTVAGPNSGSAVLMDDNLNATAPGYVTQSISLSGTGLLSLSPATLPAATVDAAYSQTFTASGGAGPYLFTITAGSLPPGMSLSSSGTLSGTPTAAGASSFTVTVTDSSTGSYTGSQAYALTVNMAPTTTTLSVSNSSLNPGQSVTLTATVTAAAGMPTGTVSFYDGTTLLGTAPLNTSGVATLSTTSLSAGATHVITATYSGDSNFLTSTTTASTSVVVAPLDFTLTLSGPAIQTAVPGSAISYQVVVDPLYGSYAGPVSFTVSGLPAGATATFDPATVAANGGKQTITVTIQTAALAAARPAPSVERRLMPLTLALLFLPLIGAGRMRRQGRRMNRWVCLVLLLGGMAATAAVSGCGSSNGFFAEAQQSYNVTITADGGGVEHSATVTLQVE